MKKYFEQLKTQARSEIKDSFEQTLKRDGYEKRLVEKYEIIPPRLNKEQTKVRISSEKITSRNAPNNFSYRPGEEYDFATFEVPIKGDMDFFKRAVKHFRFNRFFKFEDQSLFYKEVSSSKISGNDEEIERIKDNAKEKFDSIENILVDHKENIETFNEEIKSIIDETIDKEKTKRNTKNSSEDKLNPFN